MLLPFSPIRALCYAVSSVRRPLAGRHRAARHAFHYERVLGTSFELQVVATNADVARRVESAVLSEVDRLAQILSSYSATSELSRWQATNDVDVSVSTELAEILEASEDWRIWTGGAFNPAAVSLVELLHDASPSANGEAVMRLHPVRDSVAELSQPLWTVHRARGMACRLTRLAVSLDALAKGYIVDRAAAVANAVDGVTQVLVNIGGDLRHHGACSIEVAVADPRAPAENAPPVAVVRLRGEALATSGGYRRRFIMDGRAVSHILDPRTGRPADRVISASVIAADCASADALSTAFSVLMPAESVALADSSKAARLTLSDVVVDADVVVGEVDDGWTPLSRALGAGRAGAASELVGIAAGASEMTFDYLKQRKQFGRLIGEFQALQHRAAHLYGEIEIARAAAMKAAQLIDAGDPRADLFTAVA